MPAIKDGRQAAIFRKFRWAVRPKKAGMKAGDIVTAVNDEKITNSLELTHQLFKYQPGDKVK
jgi:S1-C subfamily serine protease